MYLNHIFLSVYTTNLIGKAKFYSPTSLMEPISVVNLDKTDIF